MEEADESSDQRGHCRHEKHTDEYAQIGHEQIVHEQADDDQADEQRARGAEVDRPARDVPPAAEMIDLGAGKAARLLVES